MGRVGTPLATEVDSALRWQRVGRGISLGSAVDWSGGDVGRPPGSSPPSEVALSFVWKLFIDAQAARPPRSCAEVTLMVLGEPLGQVHVALGRRGSSYGLRLKRRNFTSILHLDGHPIPNRWRQRNYSRSPDNNENGPYRR